MSSIGDQPLTTWQPELAISPVDYYGGVPSRVLFNIFVSHPRRICPNRWPSKRATVSPLPQTQWDESRRDCGEKYHRCSTGLTGSLFSRNGKCNKETCSPKSFILKENIHKIVCPSSRVLSYSFFFFVKSRVRTLNTNSTRRLKSPNSGREKTMCTCTCH